MKRKFGIACAVPNVYLPCPDLMYCYFLVNKAGTRQNFGTKIIKDLMEAVWFVKFTISVLITVANTYEMHYVHLLTILPNIWSHWIPWTASGDATDAFENVGHSSSAEAMMEKYLIGSVDGYVAPHVASGVTSKASSSVNTNKPVVAPPSSSFNPLPLIAIVLAVAAWYYFTFISKNKE